ncbi:hypothetical protein D3C78_1673740 [compost metagenome]
MDVDGPEAGNVEHLAGEDLPEGDHDDQIRRQVPQRLDHLGVATQALRLVDRDAVR